MQVNIPLKIIGLGRYLPKRVVPSSELEAMCGVPAGWVERRNGVRERRWVTDETSSFMSAEAGREALEEAVEFADHDWQCLTPAGDAMLAKWRAALSEVAPDA